MHSIDTPIEPQPVATEGRREVDVRHAALLEAITRLEQRLLQVRTRVILVRAAEASSSES